MHVYCVIFAMVLDHCDGLLFLSSFSSPFLNTNKPTFQNTLKVSFTNYGPLKIMFFLLKIRTALFLQENYLFYMFCSLFLCPFSSSPLSSCSFSLFPFSHTSLFFIFLVLFVLPRFTLKIAPVTEASPHGVLRYTVSQRTMPSAPGYPPGTTGRDG